MICNYANPKHKLTSGSTLIQKADAFCTGYPPRYLLWTQKEEVFTGRRNKKQNGTFICTSCNKEVEAESEVCPYCNELFVKEFKLNQSLFPGIWRLLLALFVLLYLFPKWMVAFRFGADSISVAGWLGELAVVSLILVWPGLKRLKLIKYRAIYLQKDYMGFLKQDNSELIIEKISNIQVAKSKIIVTRNDESGIPLEIKIRRKIDVDSKIFNSIVKDTEKYYVEVD